MHHITASNITSLSGLWAVGPTLVCHVDEPLDTQRVQGGDEVESDPRGHEERQTDPVYRVPRGGHALTVPLTAVEQGDVRVNQPEFILK